MSQQQALAMSQRPEVELFLRCARNGLDVDQSERVRALLEHDLDWTYIIDNAIFHGTVPLLFHNLQAIGLDRLPESVAEQLQAYFNSNSRHNLRLTHHLIKVLELFDSHGILALPYKGPALAVALYGSVLLRQFSDLDILVPKRQRTEARDLLLAQGYELWKDMTAAQSEAHDHSGHAYTLIHPDSELAVDLHWSFAQKHFAIALDPARLWERATTVTLPAAIPGDP